MVSLIFKNVEGNASKISKKHRAKRIKRERERERDLIKTRVNDAPRRHRLCLLFRSCFSVASSSFCEKSPKTFCRCVVVLLFCCCLGNRDSFLLGRRIKNGCRKNRVLFCCCVPKFRPKKISTKLAQNTPRAHAGKKIKFQFSKTAAFPSVRPSSRRRI